MSLQQLQAVQHPDHRTRAQASIGKGLGTQCEHNQNTMRATPVEQKAGAKTQRSFRTLPKRTQLPKELLVNPD